MLAETRGAPRQARKSVTPPLSNLRKPPLQVVAAEPTLAQRVEAVAVVARGDAPDVDRLARFPAAALTAARERRLMSLYAPRDCGGDEASVSDVVETCYALARACASTGMIYAMHQIMVACLVHHGQASPWHRQLLRDLADNQLLLASSTTDGQGGGDLRRSDSCVVPGDCGFTLVKNATVMSYGAQADAVLMTARRTPDAQPSDQVLVALRKQDYRATPSLQWDTLGMRGTCSAGFKVEAAGMAEQIFPDPYQRIHALTVTPVAHLTWSAVWAGIAASAVDRARAFVRNAARKAGGQVPPGAVHLTRATATLSTLRSQVASALRDYETKKADESATESMAFQTSVNLLKVTSSELAIATVTSALQACGLSGYRNDGDFSVARNLRDVLSSSIMINNDRILANSAGAAMLVDVAATLTR